MTPYAAGVNHTPGTVSLVAGDDKQVDISIGNSTKRFWTHRVKNHVMADSTLDPQLLTLDRGSDAAFGCGGAAL